MGVNSSAGEHLQYCWEQQTEYCEPFKIMTAVTVTGEQSNYHELIVISSEIYESELGHNCGEGGTIDVSILEERRGCDHGQLYSRPSIKQTSRKLQCKTSWTRLLFSFFIMKLRRN